MIKLRACPLDARVLEDAETGLVVADVRTHIGEEDARRLAACWNACVGIPAEALERGAVRGLIEAGFALWEWDDKPAPRIPMKVGDHLWTALRALGRIP